MVMYANEDETKEKWKLPEMNYNMNYMNYSEKKKKCIADDFLLKLTQAEDIEE